MDAFYLCGGALNVKTCPVGPSQCAKIVIILFFTLHAYWKIGQNPIAKIAKSQNRPNKMHHRPVAVLDFE